MIHSNMRGSEQSFCRRCRPSSWWRWYGFVLALTMVAVPPAASADVIYLKNGKTIVAEVVREDVKQIFCQRGGAEFAIPRSLVERIEKSTNPVPEDSPGASPSQAATPRNVPLPPPPAVEASSDGNSPAIKDGAIDEAYLQRIDNEFIHTSAAESRRLLKQGYQEAALFLTRKGDPEGAIERYRHALRLLREDEVLTLSLGYLLVKQNHYMEAMDLLLPAADHHPKSADFHLLLGSAFYGMENLDQAIDEWKKALALHENLRIREAIEKAERERSVAGSYLELRSEHFLLRYEGRETEALSEQVLKTLEAVFRDLQLDLDFFPTETIIVLLYPSQAFRDITRTPNWVGAMNDGKIRVPVSGLTVMTPELARVLKHELTHSFVRQITLGRCPTWFNEGLAQLEEGVTTASLGSQLAKAFASGRGPIYSALEAPFMNLPQDQVALAYGKSLAALEYVRETFGMGEIRRLLKALPSNPDLNSLFQDELRLSYPAFEQEVANYIVKRYGS